MSAESSICPRCSLYQGEVALLRAEIAGLQSSVLSLTRPPANGASVLEIIGMHVPERLSLAGPFCDGPDICYRVSLSFRDQLSAQCMILITEPAEFLRFFDDLAQHGNGWEGEKRIASYERQFVIICTYDGDLYRPEVHMEVFCAVCDPSFDPYWTVQLRLDVEPTSLQQMAAQARTIFGSAEIEKPD